MLVQHLAHVPVGFFDRRLDPRPGKVGGHVLRQPIEHLFFGLQFARSEIADEQLHRGSVDRGLHHVGVH